jgi:hypothetical protein
MQSEIQSAFITSTFVLPSNCNSTSQGISPPPHLSNALFYIHSTSTVYLIFKKFSHEAPCYVVFIFKIDVSEARSNAAHTRYVFSNDRMTLICVPQQNMHSCITIQLAACVFLGSMVYGTDSYNDRLRPHAPYTTIHFPVKKPVK